MTYDELAKKQERQIPAEWEEMTNSIRMKDDSYFDQFE
jgi:hypothetical protein